MESKSSPNGKNTVIEGAISPVSEEGGGSRDFLKQSILANSAAAAYQRKSSIIRELDENVDYSNEIYDDDDDDDEIEQIPMSMEEIYKMSNKNRRKAKKGPVPFFSDEAEVKDEEMDVEKAEELISRSGPLGGNYFDNLISESKYAKSQDETFINNDKDDVELMIELGWLKDQAEADEMVSEQRHSIEAGENADGKEKYRTIDGEANDKKSRSRRGGKNKSSNSSVDFSKVGATSVGGAKGIDSNQFYEGIVGMGGGALSSATSAKERKKQSNTRKVGKRIGAYRK